MKMEGERVKYHLIFLALDIARWVGGEGVSAETNK